MLPRHLDYRHQGWRLAAEDGHAIPCSHDRTAWEHSASRHQRSGPTVASADHVRKRSGGNWPRSTGRRRSPPMSRSASFQKPTFPRSGRHLASRPRRSTMSLADSAGAWRSWRRTAAKSPGVRLVSSASEAGAAIPKQRAPPSRPDLKDYPLSISSVTGPARLRLSPDEDDPASPPYARSYRASDWPRKDRRSLVPRRTPPRSG